MSRDALVVGVNTYQTLPGLQAPAQDAESVARCLERFGECRVVRLPEAITHQKPVISQRGVVTTAMLEEALIKLFKPAGKTVPQTAIFYYSGHGLQRQAGIQEGYLATSDANPATGQYGLSLHWLRRLLQESPVRQRVILLDCCNSGEFFNMLEADPGARAGTDRLFMAAAREYEAAYESLGGSHSVFTQALLSGLNPYKVKGGIVNGHSLTDQVNRSLKGELQQPLFESSGSEIVLTRAAGMATSSATPEPPLLDRLQKLRYGFCPFPGAAPFEPSHSSFFFGREEVTQTLVQQVQTHRLCALVGPSGTGKTSLLRAGLMPQLSQQIAATSTWDVRYVTLGETPLTDLAELFVEATVTGVQRAEQLRQAESFLRQGADGFCRLVQSLVGGGTTVAGSASTELVLVIDRAEALLGADEDSRLAIAGLTAAVQHPHLSVRVVVGLRAHHLPDLAAFPDFQALVADHTVWLPPLTYNQLKATIIGPLERVGLRYDANLVYTLLLDVVSAPADLALLQRVLKTLWERREPDTADGAVPRLTLAAYAEMGGLRQVVNRCASDLYDSLSAAEQAIAQRILLGLCDLGDSGSLTRRPVTLPELVTATMPKTAVVETLEKLVAARLVVAQAPRGDRATTAQIVPGWATTVTSAPVEPHPEPHPEAPPLPLMTETLGVADPVGPTTTGVYFDIAHEALIRSWPPLQQWLQERGLLFRQQRALESAALEWDQRGQPNHTDYFLSETRLSDAVDFQQTHPDQPSLVAHRYLDACRRHARRSCRQRRLVQLLIPLSMAAGMVTAYGHSHLIRPGHGLTAPKPATAAVNDRLPNGVPTFELVAPAQNPSPEAASPGSQRRESGLSALGSPQAGVIGTGLLRMPAPWEEEPREEKMRQPYQAAASPLQAAVGRMTLTLERSAAPSAQPSQTKTELPLPGANQVVKLESWWVSPDNPALVIQIWCTRGEAEPVCFTTSTSATASPSP